LAKHVAQQLIMLLE